MMRPFAIDYPDPDHGSVSSINHADVIVHTSCTLNCLQQLNASIQPAADPKTPRTIDEDHKMQSHHHLKQLGSHHRLNPSTWEEKDLVKNLDAIQATMEADHRRRIMEVRKQEEERQRLLKMNEIWVWVCEVADDLDKATPPRKKVAFSGVGTGAGGAGGAGGGGAGAGSTGDSQQVRRGNEAKKAKAKAKAKTLSEKVASGITCGIWVERTRGGLCLVRKRSERKKK